MTQANAAYLHQDGEIQVVAATALSGGDIVQNTDGRALVRAGLKDSDASELVDFYTRGVFDVAAASGTTFSAGEPVWWDESAELAINAGSKGAGDFYIGKAIKAKVSGETAVQVELNTDLGAQLLQVISAASSALTGSSTETELARVTIPAGTLFPGAVIDFFASVIATATNSTDTLRVRVRKDSVSGDVLADSGAVDVADNDAVTLHGQANIRTVGASGTYVAAAQGVIKTTAFNTKKESATWDTTADVAILLTGQWSTTSGSNSCRADQFNAFKLG